MQLEGMWHVETNTIILQDGTDVFTIAPSDNGTEFCLYRGASRTPEYQSKDMDTCFDLLAAIIREKHTQDAYNKARIVFDPAGKLLPDWPQHDQLPPQDDEGPKDCEMQDYDDPAFVDALQALIERPRTAKGYDEPDTLQP